MASTAPSAQARDVEVRVESEGAGASSSSQERQKPGENLQRAGTLTERAGTALKSAGSNLQLQRANTLPTEDKELRHAATMPMTFDIDAERPCCFGLWKVQQFFGLILGLLFLICFSTSPPIKTYPLANNMLGITFLCACFWIFEVMPVYITALLPMVFIPFFEIASSEFIAKAYWNWISMLVVAVYLVDIGLEHVQLPRRLALQLLLKAGITSPASLLACFMGLCWILSMFLNSIAVALVVTPFAIGLMNAAEDRARVAAEAAADAAQEQGARAQDVEAEGRRDAEKVQQFADGLLIGIAYSASAGGIATITGAIPNYFLAGEAVVSGEVTWARYFGFGLPISIVVGILVYITLYVRYVRNLDFGGISREVLEQEYETFVAEHGRQMSRDEVVVGVLQVVQIILLIIRPFTFAVWFDSPFGDVLVNDATVALIPAVLLFIIPSQARPGESVLTWPAVHEKFDFGLLLLIGGAMAINRGFWNSGLSIALGEAMKDLIPRVGPYALNLIIVACVTLASQVLSSISTASTMLPILSAAAMNAMINPLSLMLPATVATSFSFLLPTASPPNVVVLAKSQELSRPLRFRDFFTNGCLLTIVCIFVGSALSLAMRLAVFDDSDALPEWACLGSSGMCQWVPVEGFVHGVKVAEQACIVDMGPKSNGGLCRLQNGDMLNTTTYLSVPSK